MIKMQESRRVRLLICMLTLLVAAFVMGEGVMHAQPAQAASAYKIVYKLNGGTQASGQVKTVKKGKTLKTSKLKKPSRRGYAFKGWYKNAKLTKKATVVYGKKAAKNRRVYAKWSKVTYSITYKLDGGTLPSSAPKKFTVTDKVVLPTAPTKAGYTFKGWYTNAALTTRVGYIAAGSINSRTFYAKWSKNAYSIEYVLNGGEVSDDAPASYTVTDQVALPVPTKDGYTFEGWYESADFSGNALNSIAAGTFGDKTLYAKWSIAKYSVAYNLDGGTLTSDAPTSYTIEDKVTLCAPTKDGYAFEGWYEFSDFSGSSVTSIAAGSTGNVVLYAKWREATTLLAIFVNDSDASDVLAVVCKKSEFVESEIATSYSGYTFKETCDHVGEGVTCPDSWPSKITNLLFKSSVTLKDAGISKFSDFPALKYVEAELCDVSSETSLQELFANCANLTKIVGLKTWNVSCVQSMRKMFYGCAKLESIPNLEEWNTSSVNDVYEMFEGCSSLELIDLSGWNLSGVSQLGRMFNGCKAATSINLSRWTLPSKTVGNMNSMFNGCSSLTDLNMKNWTVNGVKSLASTFAGCSSLESIDLSGWSTTGCTTTHDMFSGCTKLQTVGDLSAWFKTSLAASSSSSSYSSAAGFANMFKGCSSLTTVGDLSAWNVSTVTDMSSMFEGCSKLTTVGDLNAWNTAATTKASRMFANCTSLPKPSITFGDSCDVTDAFLGTL